MEACYAIRWEVFVHEQAVPEDLELDSYDATAHHLLVFDEDGTAAGTARVMLDTPELQQAKIGRVAVRSAYRGRGHAARLMAALEAKAVSHRQISIILDAQMSVIPMYEKLGYKAYGPVFDDAGIDHRKMTKLL
jgi:predicted GNAT family N-acyltransferase